MGIEESQHVGAGAGSQQLVTGADSQHVAAGAGSQQAGGRGSQVAAGSQVIAVSHAGAASHAALLRFFSHPRKPRPAQAGLKVIKTVSVAISVQRVQKRKLFNMACSRLAGSKLEKWNV